MNADLENNEYFKQLPEETKEKLRNCKSEEEAMEILREEMIPIPDELLDDVAGGESYYCVNCSILANSDCDFGV